MAKFSLFFLSLVTIACASPHVYRDLQVHESRSSVPSGFTKVSAAPEDQQITLRLGLVQSDFAGLEKALYAVSTPSSDQYGQHLSKEEVEQFVAPAPESVSAVKDWLQSNNLTSSTISPAGDWLSIQTTVKQANAMFDTQFSTFTHEKTNTKSVRTMQYSIPAALKGHLDFVHPTVSFPAPAMRHPIISHPISSPVHNLTASGVAASCGSGEVTPACLQSLYSIPSTPATQKSNAIGVAGFYPQFPNSQDLKLFLQRDRPDISSSTTFTSQSVDNGRNPGGSGNDIDEANLDVQYTVGLATGVPNVFVFVGENTNDGVDGFLDIINFLLKESNPPQVFTTSYGFDENQLSRSVATNLCNAYAQLGARGVSVLFASGDGGVGGGQPDESCRTFIPAFPGGCPFQTAVGATAVSRSGTESAAALSSGGFSNYFGIPDYQADAVSGYLKTLGSTNRGLYNASGRGFPDVSAVGSNVQIALDGELVGIDGTSCSSPIFASVVGLLNDALIAAGKSPLGFLNPFLYSTGASAFTDITSGDNPGCNTNGFPAKAGWDPVTGLGTPNFAKLKAAVGL
ncbi:subtilisin-like protein [Dentipellis sp. KUC8613]|nr:subtilisin-like protein [Dentipellis sp. KUC8613]